MAADTDFRVVGAPYADMGGLADVGQAFVYNAATGTVVTLNNPTPASGDLFGYSVAVSGNTVVVGAPGDDADAGAVYVFNATTGVLIRLDATPASGDQFGYSVAVSGNTVVVGAPTDDKGGVALDAGSAHIFNAATGNPVATLNNPSIATGDIFGVSVAVSGNTVVVGASKDDTNGADAGAAYLFNATTGALITALNASPASGDHFGQAVAVSGNTVVVGAPLDDKGGVAADAGSAHLFNAVTGAWTATLDNPTIRTNDNFGVSVAVSGSTVVVGAFLDDTGDSNAGSAYVFDPLGALIATVNNPTPASADLFGIAVAVSGNTFIVGASSDNTQSSDQGGAYVFSTAKPAIAIGNETATEGTLVTFTLTLSNPASEPTSVSYSTSNNSATSNDYTGASGVVNFPAYSTSQTISIATTADTTFEPAESFFLNLASPTGLTMPDPRAVGTIANDDPIPALSIGEVTATEGQDVIFTLTLSNPSDQSSSVNFGTANNSASTDDYTGASGVVTFPAGTTSQTISIVTTADTTFEAAESFFLNLASPSGLTLADTRAFGTIANDDPIPAVSIDDVTVTEGQNVIFTLTLSNPSDQPSSVNFSTANDSAATDDYVGASGAVTFPAGNTSQTISIVTTADTTFEPGESFFVNLTSPSGLTIADNLGIGTITDDDVEPTVSISDAMVTEGNSGTSTATFTVTLSNPSHLPITIAYDTADGAATIGDGDFLAASDSLTFDPGETSKSIDITVNGDTTFELSEQFVINLSNPSNASILDGEGEGTIANDDTRPTFGVSGVTVAEGGTAVLPVLLSNASYQVITLVVDWGEAAPQYYTVAAGSTAINLTHEYLDDGPSPGNGSPADVYTVNVTGSDPDGSLGSANTSVTVSNVAPASLNLSLSATTIDENGSTTLSGSFTDAGTLDTHTVTIAWGDGSVTPPNQSRCRRIHHPGYQPSLP